VSAERLLWCAGPGTEAACPDPGDTAAPHWRLLGCAWSLAPNVRLLSGRPSCGASCAGKRSSNPFNHNSLLHVIHNIQLHAQL
jgi:hypothetical protein